MNIITQHPVVYVCHVPPTTIASERPTNSPPVRAGMSRSPTYRPTGDDVSKGSPEAACIHLDGGHREVIAGPLEDERLTTLWGAKSAHCKACIIKDVSLAYRLQIKDSYSPLEIQNERYRP